MTFELWLCDLAITACTPTDKWYFLLQWKPLSYARLVNLSTGLEQ
jgi:hypothetical protein